MNKDIQTTKNMLSTFKSLSSLEVQNFFTNDNEKWGPMGLRTPNVLEKYREVFSEMNRNIKYYIHLGVEQNDNIQFLNDNNLEIYKLFNVHEVSDEKTKPVVVSTDAIITKLKMPILVTPADCAIICITGIDEDDGKRFIAIVHAGIFGVMLGLHKKVIKALSFKYTINQSNLLAYVFPAINGENYIKPKSDKVRGRLQSDEEWQKYLIDIGENIGISFKAKIIDDLSALGVKVVDSGINNYDAAKEDKLFSYTYNKEIKNGKGNFLVAISL